MRDPHEHDQSFWSLENIVMAYRYLYYVKGTPAVPDWMYDEVESEARQLLPETSPVHLPGSDLESSYTENQINLASFIIAEYGSHKPNENRTH